MLDKKRKNFCLEVKKNEAMKDTGRFLDLLAPSNPSAQLSVSSPIHKVAKEQLAYLSEGSMISSKPITIVRGKGIYLWDIHDNRYLDLFSQTWSMPLGHNNKKVIKAARKQLTRITHLRTAYSTEEKLELAQKIIKLSPAGLTKVHFVLHGSLAVEGAMKLAINNYEDRYKILFLEDGFHGRSLATMGISWKLPSNKYNNYFTNGIEVKKDLMDIEEKMKSEKPAAIIIELVQGDGGCKILDKELVRGIRKLCDEHDIVMIVDEVQTAFGCMGEMFLCDDYEIVPDILVFGKAIGGGFPLAGTISKDKFSFQSGEHSFTFGHNPVSMAAGLAYLKELQPALERVDGLSRQIESSLLSLEGKYKNLVRARCIGVKGAIDVVDEQGNPDCETADLIVSKMLEKSVIIANSRSRQLGNTLMLQSPLIITSSQLKSAFDVLDGVLSEIYSWETITLGDDFKTGRLKNSVGKAYSRLRHMTRSNGEPVFSYRYNPGNEINVEYNGVWYKFSFVPERMGDYDQPIPIDQIPGPEQIQDVAPHQAPKDKACPFCVLLEEEVLFFLNFPSGREYILMINIEEYGEEHMILAAKGKIPQVLDEAKINDLLVATRALGSKYEGSFTSSSGASNLHFHGQFYRKKTPVWRNIEESRIKITNQQDFEGVTIGDLSNWPARTRIIQGEDLGKITKVVWSEISDLISKKIPYNTKFLYTGGIYKWLIAPRMYGFMTYAGYFLEPEGAPKPESVSGCGSIESPGGDAVMFFKDDPKKLTKDQKQLMAERFSAALCRTSNWSWQPPAHTSSPIKGGASLWRDGQLNLQRPIVIAHRIESLDQAREALRKGAQVLEVDVQMTKDNVLVAFRGNIEAKKSEKQRYVYELTLNDLEERLQERLLKLNDLFELVKGKAAVDLDIKDWSDGIVGYKEAILNNIVSLIKKYDVGEDVFAESFNGEYVRDLKERARAQSLEIVTGIAIPGNEETSVVLPGYINKAKETNAQVIFIYPDKLTQESIDAIHKQGLLVVTKRKGLGEALLGEVDMLAVESSSPIVVNFLEMSQEEILGNIYPDIKDHSVRHAQIAVMITKAINLPDEQIEMVRHIGWAHDIGGLAKVEHLKEHQTLLQLEFVKCPGGKHGVKPSFNSKVCIEHAKERIKQGLRGPLTTEEISNPYLLYKEEFELLKGAPLTDTEKVVLRSWWYHALFSVKELRKRNISLTPETEAIIRCNEQPWLIDTDPTMLELAEGFKLEPSAVKRLLSIVRASDILENGNNKYRRDLRGVPIEDFDTTIKFIEYKFQIDGLGDYREVIDALKKLLGKQDNDLLRVIFAARQTTKLLSEDITFIQTQQQTDAAMINILDKIPLARDSSIKVVIFDWGNVISRFDWRLPAKEFAKRFGIDDDSATKLLAEEEDNPNHPLFRHERGMINEEQLIEEIKQLLGLGNVEITKQDFEEIFNNVWINNTIGEVVSLIQALKEKDYKIFLLTTTNAINYRYLVERSELLELLGLKEENIFASHITRMPKPDVYSYKQVVDYAGVLPQQCLFVDNGEENVDGAKKASLKAVLFKVDEIGESIEAIITALSIENRSD